ncbi:MAG: hypothetical protein BWY76_02953 [bacterium ADurb.Bin429]|nr:MAG: hypothetical protein BWY76_02953 [bacterium ADurb.Bin429]
MALQRLAEGVRRFGGHARQRLGDVEVTEGFRVGAVMLSRDEHPFQRLAAGGVKRLAEVINRQCGGVGVYATQEAVHAQRQQRFLIKGHVPGHAAGKGP